MISTTSNRNPSEWDTAGGVDKQPSKTTATGWQS